MMVQRMSLNLKTYQQDDCATFKYAKVFSDTPDSLRKQNFH